ncbi:hypothetical protein SKAU_G00005210 [Synaphobranchus kaupii]|uniref:Uncharacterized protein n=1 Tax=Synaphobranchus kaupii TaxID=118154 RepID=A0A9Q1GA18_SYNKA|nr:hypothetical protein SKAU_G00005210 [Synaphobranchus kaupii]
MRGRWGSKRGPREMREHGGQLCSVASEGPLRRSRRPGARGHTRPGLNATSRGDEPGIVLSQSFQFKAKYLELMVTKNRDGGRCRRKSAMFQRFHAKT